jgi:Mu-like prophage major head subunit gpT
MITRAQALVLLEPKLSNIWHDAFPSRPIEYTTFANIRETRKRTVTDYKLSDFGPLVLKPEGENITYDDPLFGSTQEYTPVRFALGYKVTQEMVDHELYGQVEKFERALIKSAIDLQEVKAALLFNNGFGTTDADGFEATGFDGLQLFSTAHTRLDGGATWRNRPATDVDLSVTGLQNALIDIENTPDDRGRPILIRPKLVIINPEDRFTAKEILESEYKPGTANNEINALLDEGLSFMVSHYITDADAWFVLGDQHDLNFIWDQKPRGGMEEDFDSEVIKRKIVEGFFVGHGEARGAWGTSGG